MNIHARLAGLVLAGRGAAVALALLLGAPAATAQAPCGEDLQAPCVVQTVRTPCWACWDGYCGTCYSASKACKNPGSWISDNLCVFPPAYPIPRPQPVDFYDGPNHVTAGYFVTVDLHEAWIVIPNLALPATCNGNSRLPNALQTVVPDPDAPWVPNWAGESSPYNSRLAINGSFFEVFGYGLTGNIHKDPCTALFGYVLSNKALVNPEGQIKVYSKYGPPVLKQAGTLVFYTADYARQTGREADIRWYPMFPGNPSHVPAEFQNAISGTQLLKNGVYVGDNVAAPDPICRLPRTAVGLSADGNSLIMVVVNPGKNGSCTDPVQATTLGSLAAYMKSLGAQNAIALDGGGSSQMYYTATWRSSPLRTLPSDQVRGMPGFNPSKRYYRPVANFLGIRE